MTGESIIIHSHTIFEENKNIKAIVSFWLNDKYYLNVSYTGRQSSRFQKN